MTDWSTPVSRYKLRIKRKKLLLRAVRKRRELMAIRVQAGAIRAAPILLFATVRNEMMRLPFFLDHYRRLGVGHFLIVSNDSSDGTDAFLAGQPDVSLWRTDAGYKASRFGMDWLAWLQRRFAHDKWIVTADADELLIYPGWDRRGLSDLTAWLDGQDQRSFGAMMLDLYPKGPPDGQTYLPGQDPTEVLNWFDPAGYWAEMNRKYQNVCLKGGVRERCFFADDPVRSPFLNKAPLVKWDKAYVYLSSSHTLLPRSLNRHYDGDGVERPTGLLLHTKFLPGSAGRAIEEKRRGEHFTDRPFHDPYYDAIAADPDMWTPDSVRYEGWEQMVRLGLMASGRWL